MALADLLVAENEHEKWMGKDTKRGEIREKVPVRRKRCRNAEKLGYRNAVPTHSMTKSRDFTASGNVIGNS